MNTDPSRIHPEVSIVDVGHNASISCKSNTEVKWFWKNPIFPDNILIMNKKLHVVNATILNKGYYTCIGTNQEGDVFHAEAIIKVVGERTLVVILIALLLLNIQELTYV